MSAIWYSEALARVRTSWRDIPDKPEETPDLTVRALWHKAAGTPLSAARAATAELPPLDEAGRTRLHDLIDRRLAGTPLAHLTGRQSFMGIELLASPAALIPRKETEILGTASLRLLRELARERGEATVIDLCTGSGNLALALAGHVPDALVYGADLSPEAVDLARENAAWVGETVQLEDRVEFRVGDLYAPFDDPTFHGQVDLIVCNPPYITSARVPQMPHEISGFEPNLAFDGGAFGLSIILRLIRDAPRFLRPGSWLCFEVGEGQGEHLAKRIRQNPAFDEVREECDESGTVRVLLARTMIVARA